MGLKQLFMTKKCPSKAFLGSEKLKPFGFQPRFFKFAKKEKEFKVIPRKSKEEFEGMTKKEKKDFLSNDLIERMIRVEQRVSAHFGRPVLYNQTEYYKSLSQTEKENFEKYLRDKSKKKIFRIFFFLIPVAILFFINANFTGNVVRENFGRISLVNYTLLFFMSCFFIFFIFLWRSKRLRNKKYQEHFNLLENIYSRKRFLK